MQKRLEIQSSKYLSKPIYYTIVVVNLKNYKVAKQFLSDYAVVEKLLLLSIQGLSKFKHYKPINQAIHELRNALLIMQAHQKTAEKIVSGGKSSEQES